MSPKLFKNSKMESASPDKMNSNCTILPYFISYVNEIH